MAEATSKGVITLDQLRQRREDILAIAARHGAGNVRVFGSVARGTADAASDVDILVDITKNVGGFAYFGLLEDLRRDLEALLEREVDVVELRDSLSPRGMKIAERIRRDAVPL